MCDVINPIMPKAAIWGLKKFSHDLTSKRWPISVLHSTLY